MKKTGLKNRFSDEVRNAWLDWHSCLCCGLNQWDVLHHIISPSSRHHKPGEHNESIFNSCPIHNFKHPDMDDKTENCHIGNEAWLYKDENIGSLLRLVRDIQTKQFGYVLKDTDKEFMRIYSKAYEL